MKINSPFKDACNHDVPRGSAVPEPNLPSGMPGRTGGLLPEKNRDNTIPKVKGYKEVGKDFKI
jgi:hypothetical protein